MAVSRLRLVVSGSIAQYPLGGMTWHHLQYVQGLARLGHEVFYLEDTGAAPFSPLERTVQPEADLGYLERIMARAGLADRWAYCHLQGEWRGMSDRRRASVLSSADLLLNVSGVLSRPESYRGPRLAFVDTDPVFNRMKLARGDRAFREMVDAHDAHFTFGERLVGAPDTGRGTWHATRQPIVLSEWSSVARPRDVFTTVMNWRSRRKTGVQGGREHGEKDVELLRFIDLPRLVAPVKIELALNPGKLEDAPVEFLLSKGWRIVDPYERSLDLDTYRDYVRSSFAEWSVAKNGYVEGQPGWFSERSACYLAAGRPTVVQDTGFSSILPTGEGIVAFRTVDEAAEAIRDVATRYDRHSEAARAIARDYFDSDKVLSALVEQALR
ncbi:MAG: glycosyltransferase family 1 protein [Thermoleophilaceae bacterium]|nr:glycosyltransferase family 1 protein [Thermoleophilaceae bacterium]